MGFERRDLPRHHRTGNAQLLRHRRKTAQFGDADEKVHGIESVHCCNYGNEYLLIVGYFDAERRTKVRPSLQELPK